MVFTLLFSSCCFLVSLLSCYVVAVNLSIVEMDNASFESFMRQNLSTVTDEMDKALLESFMRQLLYEVASSVIATRRSTYMSK